MEIEQLLQFVNEKHATGFTLLKRFSVGEQGAFSIVDPNNKKWVLKWAANIFSTTKLEQAALFTTRLKSLGYPVPTYLFTGTTPEGTYSIQEELPGNPHLTFPPSLLNSALRLNSLQRGQAAKLGVETTEWHERVIQTVLMGGDGFCLLETMRATSPATARLLDLLQTLVIKSANSRFPTGDIVHFDFSPLNILTLPGKITGVIDWQDPCAGDCTFDLVTLLFYTYHNAGLRKDLWQEILGRVDIGIASVYLAHLVLRQVEWSIRHHDPATTRGWLTLTEKILQDLSLHFDWIQIPNFA